MMEKSLRLRRMIESLLEYLKPLMPIADCHMVDYFTANHWDSLIPEEIRCEVKAHGTDGALEAFWRIRCNLSYSEDDSPEDFKHIKGFIRAAHSHCRLDDEVFIAYEDLQAKLGSSGWSPVDSIKIREFMSDKKSHEVEVMSSFLKSLSDWSGCTHVVDLGGGKGYLSSVLALFYNVAVLNVDYSDVNAVGAKNRNKNLERLWPSLLNSTEITRVAKNATIFNENNEKNSKVLNAFYRHTVNYVTLSTDLVELVRRNFLQCDTSDVKLCITGLHTCGSLGSTSLRLFAQSSAVSTLCTVPCCFHLITESQNAHSDEIVDFPMCSFLKGVRIGRNARMLSSQSMERIVGFKDHPCESIFYRALLQVVLGGGTVPEGKMKKIRNKCKDFVDYVKVAEEKLGLGTTTVSEERLRDIEKEYEARKRELALFYLLRSCLAPVVERLVLLDRLAFLLENGFDGVEGEAFLVRMFNPVLSPRCNSLIAYRNKR